MPAMSPVRRHTPSMLIAVVVLAVLFVGAVAAALFINARRGTLETANTALADESSGQQKKIREHKDDITELTSSIGKDITAPIDIKQVKTDLRAELLGYLEPVPVWDPNGGTAVTTIKAQIEQNPNTVAVFKALRGWVDMANKRISDAEKEKQQLEADKTTLQNDVAAVKKAKEDQNTTLSQQIRNLEDSKAKLQQQHAADYKDLETNLRGEIKKVDDDNKRLERLVKTQQIEIQKKDDLIKKLRRDIAERDKPAPPPGGEGTGGQPGIGGVRHTVDGRIMQADVDRGVVYLDLGRRDHVPLGMQFRVYSATEKNLDPINEGKGLIEVTKVMLTVSECRVVKTGEGEMVQGDVVVNPVYKRGQRMKFFVFGQFDLDGDGRPDSRGLDRIKQLITKWGGEVVDKISVNTDYGVMGLEPELPTPPGPDADPITQQQYKNKKAQYDQYKQQLANLRDLSTPILNQNRFLSFIGYYERQATQ